MTTLRLTIAILTLLAAGCGPPCEPAESPPEGECYLGRPSWREDICAWGCERTQEECAASCGEIPMAHWTPLDCTCAEPWDVGAPRG